MDKAPDHWSKHAQQWQRIGAPLRPVAEDIQVLERVLERWYAADRPPAPQAMLLLVEIIGADGTPCRPGEVGRLVISRLHDFATPLIRYELGDYAEASTPCPCGRGLPTIARILGRSRNMLTLPTGEQRWPLVGFDRYREIAPIRQYQLIQHTLRDIEVRFVVDRSLTADEETRLTKVIHASLGYPFRLKYVYFSSELPRESSGKFEEFVSKLAA